MTIDGIPKGSILSIAARILCLFPNRISAQGSRHFQVEEVKPGIYAALHRPGGHAICNAGFIDLGGSVLVIDPFIAPEAALELRETIAQRLSKPVSHVVYTHHHNDHIRGAQVFADAVVLSSQGTRDLIEGAESATMESDSKKVEKSLQEWRSRQVVPDDTLGMKEKAEWVDCY